MQTFWTLNPRVMYIYQDVYLDKQQEEMQMLEVSSYMNGVYNMRAICAAMDSKKCPYPNKPLIFAKIKGEDPEELTEEKKLEYQKQLLAQLQIMQSNFETNDKKD